MKKILSVLPFVLLIAGCGSAPPGPAAGLPPSDVEQADDATGKGEWIASIPSSIPKFTGTITESDSATVMGQKMWSMTIGKTSREEMTTYIQKLKASSWISTDEESIPRFLDMSRWGEDEVRGMFFENKASDLVIILTIEKGFAGATIEIASGQNVPE